MKLCAITAVLTCLSSTYWIAELLALGVIIVVELVVS